MNFSDSLYRGVPFFEMCHFDVINVRSVLFQEEKVRCSIQWAMHCIYFGVPFNAKLVNLLLIVNQIKNKLYSFWYTSSRTKNERCAILCVMHKIQRICVQWLYLNKKQMLQSAIWCAMVVPKQETDVTVCHLV